MAATNNTFPPLVSGSSSDLIGQKHLYGQGVLTSCLIQTTQADQFFNPEAGQLTGYAADGSYYQNGVVVPLQASWFLEPPSPWRAEARGFPRQGVVLVTDAGLSILDRTKNLEMWMMFMRGDLLAYTNNFLTVQKVAAGFTPRQVTYQNGIISVTQAPDPGSTFNNIYTLHIDFLHDTIYVDCTIDERT